MSTKKADIIMKTIDAIQKDWKIITTIFTIIAAGLTMGIRIGNRVSSNRDTALSMQSKQLDDEKALDEHDDRLDNLDKRLSILEEDERLREKGLCK